MSNNWRPAFPEFLGFICSICGIIQEDEAHLVNLDYIEQDKTGFICKRCELLVYEKFTKPQDPTKERLLIVVEYKKPKKPRIHIGYYDNDRNEWRWEGGKINGVVTYWQKLPKFPED
jgi:predicted amidophosphoribosyltransferase